MACLFKPLYDELFLKKTYIDGLVPDCSISSALAMELRLSYTNPSTNVFVIYKLLHKEIEEIDFIISYGYQWSPHLTLSTP